MRIVMGYVVVERHAILHRIILAQNPGPDKKNEMLQALQMAVRIVS
jgi:hypothetical protein